MSLSTDVLNSNTFVAGALPHLCTVLIFVSQYIKDLSLVIQ